MADFNKFSDSGEAENITIADGVDSTQKATVSSNRLHVNAVIAGGGSNLIPTLGTGLVYEDMNVSNGGVARGTSIGTTWTNVYSKTGVGLMICLLATVEKPLEGWKVRMIIDGVEVFGSNGIDVSNDFLDTLKYNYTYDPAKPNPEFAGLSFIGDTIRWEGPIGLPISYTTSIVIKLQKNGGNKRFRAGFVTRTL